jgi:NADPH-dependent 2,4-dienoyl-CoA reductase/sulfur reductase-like enzyme
LLFAYPPVFASLAGDATVRAWRHERKNSPLTGLRELLEDKKSRSPKSGDTEDVVVIGSSAAGLYTAARVARGGRRVSVLESKATPDPAPRTLIVTDYFKNQGVRRKLPSSNPT